MYINFSDGQSYCRSESSGLFLYLAINGRHNYAFTERMNEIEIAALQALQYRTISTKIPGGNIISSAGHKFSHKVSDKLNV